MLPKCIPSFPNDHDPYIIVVADCVLMKASLELLNEIYTKYISVTQLLNWNICRNTLFRFYMHESLL